MIEQNILTGDKKANNVILFAHGAGAGMEHRFMAFFAEQMAISGWKVIRFEFPYMQQIRQTGNKRPPNPQKLLLESWREKIKQFRGSGRLVIAGKSMGGRMATIIADEMKADGLVVFGYPFHPTGKPEKLRTAHLMELAIPSLFLQGERDSLGNREEVNHYSLSDCIQLKWLTDGDHGLKPRNKSGHTELQNWQQAAHFVTDFLNKLTTITEVKND